MRSVVFHPLAQEELLDAARPPDSYDSEAEGLGKEFLDEGERVVGVITETPHIGVPMRDEIRRLLLRRFPFGVLYRPNGEEILIAAIRVLPDRTPDRARRSKQRLTMRRLGEVTRSVRPWFCSWPARMPAHPGTPSSLPLQFSPTS